MSGHNPNFLESLGRCRVCGGAKDYAMLVGTFSNQTLCRADYHQLRHRIACAIFRALTGKEPRQAA